MRKTRHTCNNVGYSTLCASPLHIIASKVCINLQLQEIKCKCIRVEIKWKSNMLIRKINQKYYFQKRTVSIIKSIPSVFVIH